MKNNFVGNRGKLLIGILFCAAWLCFLIVAGTSLQVNAQGETSSSLETWRISVAYDGGNANSNSWYAPSLSSDGRFVAFFSQASNLLPPGEDTNDWDIFVRDQQLGTIRLADVSATGEQSNGNVTSPVISADGRYVAFMGGGTNLGPGSDSGMSKVFLKDLLTEKVYLVSHSYDGTPLNWSSFNPSMSADGRYVTFTSFASNVVPLDDNFHCPGATPSGKCADVYVWDRLTDQVKKVSVNSAGQESNNDSDVSSISPDGRYVVFFSSATNLLSTLYRNPAIYLRDLQTGTTRLIAPTDTDAAQAAFSDDGRYIAFVSAYNGLVAGDNNSWADVFVYDQVTGAYECVSVATAGQIGNGYSGGPVGMSWDARYVVFRSDATNLVAGDTNGFPDIFLHDRQTGETTRVSVASDNTQSNAESYEAGISADGRFIAFSSGASNLVDGDIGGFDIFMRAFPIVADTWPTITDTPASASETPLPTITRTPTVIPTRTLTPIPTATATNVLVWNSTLVGTTGTPVFQGYQLEMDLDTADQPHMTYMDLFEKNLKYIYWNGSQWLTDVIDHMDDWQNTYGSMVLDNNDNPHITYFATGGLNYKYWDGTQWQHSLVGESGRTDSVVVDSLGYPHVSFCQNGILKYTHWDGVNWSTQVVDSLNGCNSAPGINFEIPTSIALGANEYPRIVYSTSHAVDFVPLDRNYQLRYAWWDGIQWNSEVIYTGPATYSSLALDSAGNPHVSFCRDWSLLYASKTMGGWSVQTVDTSIGEWPDYLGWNCGTTSLVLDGNDHPRISYWRVGATDGYILRYASWDGNKWLLDSVQLYAIWTGMNYRVLKLDSSGLPRIAYNNNNDSGGLAPGLYYASASIRIPPSGTPSVPNLQSPANGSLIRNYTPLLNWSDTTPALDHYQIQVDDNSDFSSPLVDDVSLKSSQYQFGSTLAANTKYFWRVRALNSADGTKGWSPVWSFRTVILAATLLSPSDAQVLDQRRPLLDWESVSGATGYKFVISKNANLSSPILSSTVTNSAFQPSADLPANTKLYWRVQATGPNGPSLWSSTWSFTTGNPASVPLLQSPANNSLSKSYTPHFNWSNSTLPSGTNFKHYQIQVDNDLTFSSTEIDDFTTAGQIAASDYMPAVGFVPNVKYYWRVRAINSVGGTDHMSAWSAIWNFRTVILPANLITPSDAQSLDTRRPILDWNDVEGATGYKLVISRYANLSSPILSTSLVNSTYLPLQDFSAGTKLYWRVQATGPNGPSLWSTTWSFTTGNPPSTPVLTAPANNALLYTYNPVLNWNNSTLPSGVTFLYYQIQIKDGSSDFSTPFLDTTTATGDISDSDYKVALQPNTKYYWHVRAVDSVGLQQQFSAWSAVRSLRTALETPTLLTPLNDGMNAIDTRTPLFTWNPVDGASKYTLQVSTSSSFATLLINANPSGSQYQTSASLPAGKVLFWRVCANGENGPSHWSVVFQFKTP